MCVCIIEFVVVLFKMLSCNALSVVSGTCLFPEWQEWQKWQVGKKNNITMIKNRDMEMKEVIKSKKYIREVRTLQTSKHTQNGEKEVQPEGKSDRGAEEKTKEREFKIRKEGQNG
jgi:hypothetical protein